MVLEVCTIGGYSSVGGNSVAIKIDDEVVILDMGLNMEKYIQYTEDREDISGKTYDQLLRVKAVPDYSFIKDWKEHIKALIPSHAHLDHVGAIPYAAGLFPKAPIICTPYTTEVLKSICYDEQITLTQQIIPVQLNSSYKISKNIIVEFIHVTHSIPHTAIVALHTPHGVILYANDYKFDLQPTLGKKPNFARLKQLGDKGVELLIIECLYAHEHRKMPSESVAQQMLKDVMLGVNSEKKMILVTTFSSHIARLKSIVEMGKRLNRKIVFLGRSLAKYVIAAQRLNIVNFEQDVLLVRHKDKVYKMIKKMLKEGKEKYLLVCTGHQGEPNAILSQMARGNIDVQFSPGDIIIFSCSVIPAATNIRNRELLESQLKGKGLRIFRDVHVSGHAAREDHRDLIEMVKPKYIIPAHAGNEKAAMIKELAEEMGYKNTIIMSDGKRVLLK